MNSCLLLEEFIKRRRVTTETNGNLSCFIIINKTCVRLDDWCSGKLDSSDKIGKTKHFLFASTIYLPSEKEDHPQFVYYPIEIISVTARSRMPKKKWQLETINNDKNKWTYRMMNMDFGNFIKNIIDKIIRNNSFIFHG